MASDVQILTGNQAAAMGVKLSRVQVVSAYPITPQTSLTETLSQYIEGGQLDAQYVRVESEHSAMTVCIAASTVGARVFTSTSSHGLLYMHEQLHWAAGSRLPIVMCCVNRGVGAPWSIFNDQQDSIAQRDTGWIQIYCRDNQEIIDTVIQAYRIAETVYAPVMVCYDGFVLSHTTMPVRIPDENIVAEFLPDYKPHTFLNSEAPRNINPVTFPWLRMDAEGCLRDGYMELRHKLQISLVESKTVIKTVAEDYARLTGRNYGGLLWSHRLHDADVVLTGMGSIATEATVAADQLRQEGIKAGVLGIRVYRPFPKEELRCAFDSLGPLKAVIVFEKDISYGYEGALCSEIKAALYGSDIKAAIHDYVCGLGGRDVKSIELSVAVKTSLDILRDAGEGDKIFWLNCRTG